MTACCLPSAVTLIVPRGQSFGSRQYSACPPSAHRGYIRIRGYIDFPKSSTPFHDVLPLLNSGPKSPMLHLVVSVGSLKFKVTAPFDLPHSDRIIVCGFYFQSNFPFQSLSQKD